MQSEELKVQGFVSVESLRGSFGRGEEAEEVDEMVGPVHVFGELAQDDFVFFDEDVEELGGGDGEVGREGWGER